MPSQTLPAPQRPPVERSFADCRIYERKSCDLPATCQVASVLEMTEMRWVATITDISQGGVRVILQRRFEKGTGLAIELPGDEVRESCVVFVKVTRVIRQDSGSYELGCQFISALSEDEMQRLLTSTNHVLSSAKKKDNAPEARTLTNVLLLVETRNGDIVECAIKRLNVTKCWPLTPGKVLAVRGKTRDQSSFGARIRVVEFIREAKSCEIRGELIEKL